MELPGASNNENIKKISERFRMFTVWNLCIRKLESQHYVHAFLVNFFAYAFCFLLLTLILNLLVRLY